MATVEHWSVRKSDLDAALKILNTPGQIDSGDYRDALRSIVAHAVRIERA